MRYFACLLCILLCLQSCTKTKVDYLKENRFDLNTTEFEFPQDNFKIIGFGAYHGSQKTEDVELALLTSLTKTGTIEYYFPETDYSTAHFFNKYLQSGDTTLLKNLIIRYGMLVPQERTIEVYEKWKKLKALNDKLPKEHKIQVLGLDVMTNYEYVSKHILELFNTTTTTEMEALKEIQNMVKTDTTSYALGDLSFAYQKLHDFVDEYEQNKTHYLSSTNDKKALQHIIRNLKTSFQKKIDREKVIFDNYVALDKIYDFKNKPQFIRIGFFHIEKSREGKNGNPSFFARLIEHNIYSKEEVISIIGYLTKSEVVWDELYDDNGNYTGHTTEAGFGIGDYEKEYFLGIQNLKDATLSDKTLFRLNLPKTPYTEKQPDLIEIVMQDQKSNGEAVKGMATTEFLDYAILISNSKASIPIYEMK